MTQMINQLTPDQEALIPVYQEKWRKIALSTERIDQQKAAEAVKIAYTVIDEREPEIIFVESPYAALALITSKTREGLKSKLESEIKQKLRFPILHELSNQLLFKIGHGLSNLLWNRVDESQQSPIWIQLRDQIPIKQRKQFFSECMPIETWVSWGSYFDFNFSVLKLPHTQDKWLAFQALVTECGWIFPYKQLCIVCDRPTVFSFDLENRLHAEGLPAIQFTDEFSVYSYCGLRLPFKYRKMHPNQWKPCWILEEKNVELRRALIQGIGYERICKELYAAELDSWQGYTLLEVDEDIDIEPIRLLKMICPSISLIYIIRVPPDIQSAREAIRWVNWDVDPEAFAVQT
ncbi:MAG: hypothetical protein KME45_00735 [Stenomitos rutilans HA7619-LM2]|jgi:hypothetical protein|nr:hypothetical protein [Stenomitos rutilans HA7619-LM2]